MTEIAPSDLLFTTFAHGGNVPPTLTLARELSDRGHRVRVMGHPVQQPEVAASGLPFTPYLSADHWDPAEPGSLLHWLKALGHPGITEDVRAELDRRPADLVLADCLLVALLRDLRRTGQRRAALFPTLYGEISRGWVRGPGTMLRLLRRGWAPREWRHCDLALVLTDPILDTLESPPGHLAWTGVILPPEASRAVGDTVREPRILLSLSTNYFPGINDLWQRTLDAVAPLPVDVIATIGDSRDASGLRAGPRTHIQGYVDHEALLPSCSLVVGHGGHSTTTKALAHGVPLVIIPAYQRSDQPGVGRAVAALGAGIALPAKATVEQIRDAVEKVLADPEHQRSAAALGQRLRAAQGLATAADRIEASLMVGAVPPSARPG